MPALLLNRAGQFDVAPDGWVQLAPLGEFPHAQTGLVQVIDADAARSMANRFGQDLAASGARAWPLVDFDHFSLTSDKSSEAAGWIIAIQNRADGVWGQVKWSDVGEAAVKGGRYRFLSPVWNRADCEDLGNGRVRPLRIANAAVTNDPNLRGIAPIANRAVDSAPPTVTREPTKGYIMDKATRDKLCNSLGLDPEKATDAEIEAAIAAKKDEAEKAKAEAGEMKNRAEAAEAKLKAMEAAAAESRADATLAAMEAEGVTIANRADARAALVANHDAALRVLRAVVPAAPLANRRDAKTPDGDAGVIANRRKVEQAIANYQRLNPNASATAAYAAILADNPKAFEQ